MELLNTVQNEELTMTHLQFAEITGKRNDAVKRTMETLEKQGIILVTQIVEPYISGRGREGSRTTYSVNERDSYIVMAQLSPAFTAMLVDEWKAMKEDNAIPKLPNFNDPREMAVLWIANYDETQALKLTNQANEQLIESQLPAVEFTEAVSTSKYGISMKDCSKALGLGRNTFMSILRDEGILMKNNTPYQRYLDSGFFEVRQGGSAFGHITLTTIVTGKGEIWLHKTLTKRGYL